MTSDKRNDALPCETASGDTAKRIDPQLPKLACVCPTYLRPRLLANLISCFEQFEYPKDRCELIVLDDAGQYPDQPSGENWKVYSTRERYPTLGDKRNAIVELVSPDVDAFVITDDDDVYMPWTLLAHAWALRRSELSCPDRVLAEDNDGTLVMEPSDGLFHSGWAFSRDLFDRCGRYPSLSFGEDLEMLKNMRQSGVMPCSATQSWPPWLIFRWTRTDTYHMSGIGEEGYADAAKCVSSKEPVWGLRPAAVHDWMSAATAFFEVDGDCETPSLAIVNSWRDRRHAHEVKMVRNRSRFIALRRLRIQQTMTGISPVLEATGRRGASSAD